MSRAHVENSNSDNSQKRNPDFLPLFLAAGAAYSDRRLRLVLNSVRREGLASSQQISIFNARLKGMPVQQVADSFGVDISFVSRSERRVVGAALAIIDNQNNQKRTVPKSRQELDDVLHQSLGADWVMPKINTMLTSEVDWVRLYAHIMQHLLLSPMDLPRSLSILFSDLKLSNQISNYEDFTNLVLDAIRYFVALNPYNAPIFGRPDEDNSKPESELEA